EMLLAQGWRDMGIPFYVPMPGGAGNVQVFTAKHAPDSPTVYYLVSNAEKMARAAFNPAAAFEVLSAPAEDTQPLMRVFYANHCGTSHDDLVAGQGRFEFVTHQGNRPVTTLQW